MVAKGGNVVAGREILHDLHVRGQAGTGEDPLEKVVAEESGFGHSAGHRRFESVYVVDALASVSALAEQVLVHIRDRGSIGVDAGRAGEHAQEQRAFAPHRKGWRDPWLEDAITFDNSTQTGIQARLVERMGHLADESPDRLARKPRVRVQGDDVADVGGHGRRRQERGVLGAAKEPIELG